MTRLISIDCEAHQIGLTFDYEDKKMLKFAKKHLGEHITLEQIEMLIPEIKEFKDE